MLLDRVAHDVANSLATCAELFGPFPYAELHVSQIPGGFGQGYPGLIYLSTLSFLPAAEQARLGLSERAREAFSLLTPAHEVAHQWWGNWVRLPHYRDQWLAESLAAYSALLYVEKQAGGEDVLREWLERYRADLLETDAAGNPIELTGALTLGARLDSSRSPDGYVRLIYSKGPWILHMLREMFRDPATGSDAVFFGALRRLAERGGGDPLTTAEFQRELEAVLPPQADAEKTGRLDWFFDEWVHDTGFPRYRLRWELRAAPEGRRVEGAVTQSEVSELFTMPVPVYARYGTELRRLGTVVVRGREAAFAFPVSAAPDAVLLDPYRSVLRRSE
jgi:aminopeptidase N